MVNEPSIFELSRFDCIFSFVWKYILSVASLELPHLDDSSEYPQDNVLEQKYLLNKLGLYQDPGVRK